MEILKTLDWYWIFKKLLFLFFVYMYYKFVLKMFCSHFLDDFEKSYCEKIKNKNLYFFGLLFYGFFITLFIPLILSSGIVFNSEIRNILNYDILIIIVTFLFCFKVSSLKMDKHRETHLY